MPRKKGDEMNHRIMVRLPDDAGAELERVAKEKGLEPAVLGRVWLLERLQEERDRRGRDQGRD